jgi:hypothetical protein
MPVVAGRLECSKSEEANTNDSMTAHVEYITQGVTPTGDIDKWPILSIIGLSFTTSLFSGM